MVDYESIFERIVADDRYQQHLDWGVPRTGHPEGTIRAHIAEIEGNLEKLRPKLSDTDFWKLKLLIHTHDSFKPDSAKGVPITHPESHASLACRFLKQFCEDSDLLAILQFHDEPFALWRQYETEGSLNQDRFDLLLASITDWNLFLAFNIVDGCTECKSRKPLLWLFRAIDGKVKSDFNEADNL